MAVFKQSVGTRTPLEFASLSTLPSATYQVNTSAYICNTNQPLDVIIEVNVGAAAPAGNKQVIVFLQESLDGTNFRTGPTSGTVNTDEQALKYLGTVSLNTASAQRATFSVATCLGYIPYAFKVVIKNDAGTTLNTGEVFTSEITSTVT